MCRENKRLFLMPYLVVLKLSPERILHGMWFINDQSASGWAAPISSTHHPPPPHGQMLNRAVMTPTRYR